jgi:hypothetical protein
MYLKCVYYISHNHAIKKKHEDFMKSNNMLKWLNKAMGDLDDKQYTMCTQ